MYYMTTILNFALTFKSWCVPFYLLHVLYRWNFCTRASFTSELQEPKWKKLGGGAPKLQLRESKVQGASRLNYQAFLDAYKVLSICFSPKIRDESIERGLTGFFEPFGDISVPRIELTQRLPGRKVTKQHTTQTYDVYNCI